MSTSQFIDGQQMPGMEDLLLIVENQQEALNVVSNKSHDTVLEGICAVFGQMNNNKRIYEKEEYLPHLDYLQEKIQKRQLTGELDHPQRFEPQLKHASHIIEELRYDGGDKVFIKIRLLEDMPSGKLAKALVEAGVNVSISSRAAGQVMNEGRVKLARLFTYDIVGEPGFSQAILKKTINESLKKDFSLLTESFSQLKEESIINNLEDVSESFSFGDNVKLYKLENNDFKIPVFEAQTKNKSEMTGDAFSKEQFESYSKQVGQKFTELQNKINEQNDTIAKMGSGKSSNAGKVTAELANYINSELVTEMQSMLKYMNYLAGKVDQTVGYGEHLAEKINSNIDQTNSINERLEKTQKYTEYVGQKTNEGINYMEYIKNTVNRNTKYNKYLAEMVDKGLQYTEYVGEKLDNGLLFSEYLKEEISKNRVYGEHLAEGINNSVKYTGYLADGLNAGKFGKGLVTKQLVESLNESEKVDSLIDSVHSVMAEMKSDSAEAVLENRYQFLKLMSAENKDKFYKMDTETKQAVTEALARSVYFNEAEIISIMEAVIQHKNKDIPSYVQYMPTEYKTLYDNMNESEKNTIHAKAQIYDLRTPYQVKAFWDELDLRGINERVEINKHNQKLQQLNESQSKEGYIHQDQIAEQMRGYGSGYLESMKRFANNRK